MLLVLKQHRALHQLVHSAATSEVRCFELAVRYKSPARLSESVGMLLSRLRMSRCHSAIQDQVHVRIHAIEHTSRSGIVSAPYQGGVRFRLGRSEFSIKALCERNNTKPQLSTPGLRLSPHKRPDTLLQRLRTQHIIARLQFPSIQRPLSSPIHLE